MAWAKLARHGRGSKFVTARVTDAGSRIPHITIIFPFTIILPKLYFEELPFAPTESAHWETPTYLCFVAHTTKALIHRPLSPLAVPVPLT